MKENINDLFGKLASLIAEDDIYEIAIESYHEVYAHRKSGWTKENIFTKKSELLEFVGDLRSHFEIDESEPMFSRYVTEIISVSVVLPPLAIKGPSLRISKLPKESSTLDDYLAWNAIDSKGKKVLEEILTSHEGIICGGDFGSGKTTLFNMLLNSLPKDASIVSIEPSPDITFQRERVCRLMPRGTSEEAIGEVLEAASRMRGDYITLSWMSEQWVSPYMDLLKNNSCGMCVAGGVSPQNVIDRILRQAVVSSYGYNLEEAALNLTEVFKYLVFQEKDKEDQRRYISSVHELSFRSGEIVFKCIYNA